MLLMGLLGDTLLLSGVAEGLVRSTLRDRGSGQRDSGQEGVVRGSGQREWIEGVVRGSG